jgi:tetratricopeptide (TPR) repeat protein
MLLIQQHFGYKSADQPLHLRPFQVDSATASGRITLLINQTSVGLLLPLFSAWLLLCYPRSVSTEEVSTTRRHGRPRLICIAVGVLALSIILGRTPASLVCQYQAKTLLAAGNYASASQWLDKAYTLNPALDQTPYYHRERGWIWYFLHPGTPSADSHAYLAYVYRTQSDYLDAYQELLAVWHSEPTTFWIVNEMSLTLAQQAETVSALNNGLTQTSDIDISSLSWLRLLAQVDRSNVYSQYAIARLQYTQHDYDACIAQMATVLQLSSNTDVQSSAYTYMALSLSRQGKINEARQLLLQAIVFDPAYHNNTAREELSGLH